MKKDETHYLKGIEHFETVNYHGVKMRQYTLPTEEEAKEFMEAEIMGRKKEFDYFQINGSNRGGRGFPPPDSGAGAAGLAILLPARRLQIA